MKKYPFNLSLEIIKTTVQTLGSNLHSIVTYATMATKQISLQVKLTRKKDSGKASAKLPLSDLK